METSILKSVKAKLPMCEDYDNFDNEIVDCINDAIAIMSQLGYEKADSFEITDDTSTWDELIDETKYNFIKGYIYDSTKKKFDPPTSATLMEALNSEMKEYEWRLEVLCNTEV